VIALVPLFLIEKCGATAASPVKVSRSASCTVSVTGGTQLPPAQMSGETQSVLAVQVVLQAFAPQMYGLHLLVMTVTQVPLLLQVAAGVSVAPVQLAPTHTVPEAYFWQAPLPSHLPLVPQVEAPLSVHWVATAGA